MHFADSNYNLSLTKENYKTKTIYINTLCMNYFKINPKNIEVIFI